MLTLQRGNSRESPARTALTLILDRGNVALSSPVNAVWDLDVGWLQELAALSALHHGSGLVEAVDLTNELGIGQNAKLVHADSEGLLALGVKHIVALDELDVLLPNGASVALLIEAIGLAIHGLVLAPLKVTDASARGTSDQNS